ncbi:ATP-binding protein [Streptomyces sp. NPDC047043]|uniref:ATP-binding protein n=1 Tax=Streptomyces sp. NPDC047043 TaxID=3154497 RepID=UPI0033C181F2
MTERAEQIVAELAANAALHGSVQGRDFRLAVTLDATTGLLRIAVTDACCDQLPTAACESEASSAESGRGLLLITALATIWDTEPCPPSGKTVWATIDVYDDQ